MARVVEARIGEQAVFLQELADDLDGVLSMIAYAGKDTDKGFIRENQRRLDAKYGDGFCDISDDGPVGAAKSDIGTAWYDLDLFLDPDLPEGYDIREQAEEVLHDRLLRPALDYDPSQFISLE